MSKSPSSSAKYVAPFRADGGKKFRLRDFETNADGGLQKAAGNKIIESNRERLSELQEKLYAQDNWSLLLIFQGMDAAGKDSAIKSVFDGINPQGCHVTSFKTPSSMELDHDFMWRTTVALPERGRIGIFNRSYYEECLVVRVHPEILAKQKIPKQLVGGQIWRERFEDIRAFERYLTRNGTVVLKFFLNVSKEEQRKRFLDRLEEPAKNWKFSMADVSERKLWDKYQNAYEEMIDGTATEEAPWHVVPADRKWFARVVIGSVIVNTLRKLDLSFPKVDASALGEFAHVREALLLEGQNGDARDADKVSPADDGKGLTKGDAQEGSERKPAVRSKVAKSPKPDVISTEAEVAMKPGAAAIKAKPSRPKTTAKPKAAKPTVAEVPASTPDIGDVESPEAELTIVQQPEGEEPVTGAVAEVDLDQR